MRAAFKKRSNGQGVMQPQPSLRLLEADFVRRIEQGLHCRKPDHIMTELGISLNTCNKLREGQPSAPV